MVVSHLNQQRLAECFERGQHLASVEKQYDYAHALFAECVTQDPANLAFTEALLSNLKAIFVAGKRKAIHLRLPGERVFKKAFADQDWQKVVRLGVDVLKVDPWHVPTLRAMAQACEALHYNDVELAYLKQALDSAPRNAQINRHCARSLARMGQFDQAMACWHRVEEIEGTDREAAEMISRLGEEKMNYPGGRPSGHKADDAQGKQDQEPVSEESRSDTMPTGVQVPPPIPLTPRQKLEQAIQLDLADVSNYLALADVLCEMGHFENAESTLQQAIQHCPQEHLVRDALHKTRSHRAQAEQQAAETERQKRLRAERKRFRVPWLELTLAAAGLALFFQFFPSWWEVVSSTATEHAQLLLIAANAFVVVALIIWRERARAK